MIKVLFPTDFSSTANNAFLYALNLCKNYNGELLVLHTYSSRRVVERATTEVNPAKVDRNSNSKLDFFNNEIEEMTALAVLHELDQVSVNYIIEEGELIQNIHELTQKETLHLIIMGTTGNSGFENKL